MRLFANWNNSGAEEALRLHMRELFQTLTLGLTLESDSQVQNSLRSAGGSRFSVRLDGRNCWVEIGAHKPASIHRVRPAHLSEAVLAKPNDRSEYVTNVLSAGVLRANADTKAAEILGRFMSDARMPAQNALGDVFRWAPLVEISAYGVAASIGQLLDHDRAMLFTLTPGEAPVEIRRRYWSRLTLAARLTLLSTPRAAQDWLSGVGARLDWKTTTPSWTLLRERSLWLAAVAARAAAAFGSDVAENYLQRLTRDCTPMKVLDALFGLTSIAIASSPDRRTILSETRRAVSFLDERGELDAPTLQLAAKQAITMMDDLETAKLRSRTIFRKLGLRKSLFVPGLIARDAAELTTAQEVPALSILPLALEASLMEFFPSTQRERTGRYLGLTDANLASLFLASWAPNPQPANRTLH